MDAAWICDVSVFMALLCWATKWPRNEWLGNSAIVLVSFVLALWYQPVMPAIIGSATGTSSSPMGYPFHSLVGIFILIGVTYAVLVQWDDAKEALRNRLARRRSGSVKS